MRRSYDENDSIQMNLYSLGVMDLDFSPDVFCLRAFVNEKPVTRMLPGSSPCELRLMIPDDKLGKDGFHDVIIENLSGTPKWRSSHVSPLEITSLRRQWPKAVFETLRRQAPVIERLRRDAPNRTDKAFRYCGPGYCGVCDTQIYSALDAHMMACHLELGQLWRCPVTWCAVWKGSGRACLEHLAGKHGGSTLEIKTNVAQFSPMDSDQARLARCPPTRCIRGRRRRPSVSRSRQPIGTSLPSVQRPISASGPSRRGYSQTAVKHVSGHGYHLSDSPTTLYTVVGCAAGKSPGVMFSRCRDCCRPASSSPCVVRSIRQYTVHGGRFTGVVTD